MTISRHSGSGSVVPQLDAVRGFSVPRIFTPPLRELSEATSLGFFAIEFAEVVLGLTLRDWQKWFLVHSLELLPDGRLRFKRVILLIARQNGKSFAMAVRLLWRLFTVPGTQTLSIANRVATAEEVWEVGQRLIRAAGLGDSFGRISRTNAKKYFTLRGDDDDAESRWLIDATNDDAGRGLTIDDLFFDELRQHHNWDAWSAVSGTVIARPDSQILIASNAGESKSIVLRSERDAALEAIESGNTGYEAFLAEYSAPDDTDLDDLDSLILGLRHANPSLGWGDVTLSSLLAAWRSAMPEWKFRTEHLCQWVDIEIEAWIPAEPWGACMVPDAVFSDGSRLVLGVDTSADRKSTSVSVAGFSESGRPMVELIATRPGMSWVPKFVQDVAQAQGIREVALQERGARAGEYAQELRELGLVVHQINGVHLSAVAGWTRDIVEARGVEHRGQTAVEVSRSGTPARDLNGAPVFQRDDIVVDPTAIVSVSEALYALLKFDAPDEAVGSAYEDYDLLTF